MAQLRKPDAVTGVAPSRPPSATGPRRALALLAGPALFLLVLLMPAPAVSSPAHRLAAIVAWVVAYWVTEALPLPVTALLSSALAIVLGIAPAAAVLAPYADPVIFLFIGSFTLAASMRTSGLDRRFALSLLGQPWATRTPGRLLAAVGLITCAVSLWVSNTATTAMMLPMGVGVLRALGPMGDPNTSRYPIGLTLMLTWASSVAVGVPVGSPPNLIAIGLVRELTGRRITFFDWVAVTMPATLAMLGACWLVLRWLYREPATEHNELRAFVSAGRSALGPWTPAQRSVAAIFLAAVALWMTPGLVDILYPGTPAARALGARLPESAVALCAAVAVFLLPTGLLGGEQASQWKRLTVIDWGTILLFGAGLSLGRLMFDTGLAAALGAGIIGLAGVEGLWSITALAIVAGVLMSEACSNTASASMLVPVVIAIAQGMGVSPVPPALGAALGASFGFMLPVSTPPNAIVYGSGLVPLRDMMRAGAVLDVVGIALIWLSLRLLCPLVGLV